MVQFDVHLNPNPDTRDAIPYLLDVQAMLDMLTTHMVVPLVQEMGREAGLLNPKLKIKGNTVVISTAEMAGVHLRALGDKVTSLKTSPPEYAAM